MFDKYAVTPISTVDWPERICSVVWVFGCNFRCPFCHNGDLAQGSLDGQPVFTIKEIVEGLLRRRQLIEGVCISGGEPTVSPNLGRIIKSFKNIGLDVKVDTNGSQPAAISDCLSPNGVDYLALDIKASPARYGAVACASRGVYKDVEKSLRAAIDGIPEVELRTTVVPGINCEEAAAIAEWLAPYASMISTYSVQAFVPGRSLRVDLDALPRTSYKKLESFASLLEGVGFNVKIVSPPDK